jgi:hypothetical protein
MPMWNRIHFLVLFIVITREGELTLKKPIIENGEESFIYIAVESLYPRVN